VAALLTSNAVSSDSKEVWMESVAFEIATFSSSLESETLAWDATPRRGCDASARSEARGSCFDREDDEASHSTMIYIFCLTGCLVIALWDMCQSCAMKCCWVMLSRKLEVNGP
jgi:hypothetical protein